MPTIIPQQLPGDAFLSSYQHNGHYTDCFTSDIDRAVSLPQFVEAFYTTPLFKLERALLTLFLSKPSTDMQAAQVAIGETERFSAWTVEQRSADQLLMCDFNGSTQSWFKVAPIENETEFGSRLHFGSAVVFKTDEITGEKRPGLGFKMLLGFHKIYSLALLFSAKRKLIRSR
jgi:hypothetical protein